MKSKLHDPVFQDPSDNTNPGTQILDNKIIGNGSAARAGDIQGDGGPIDGTIVGDGARAKRAKAAGQSTTMNMSKIIGNG
ncbi:hypothetical protein NVS89_08710 [Ancylobacter sp. MQZ15Z-1]|uniref:Uncharacterized protein n=1 Tax=Ancylobacter mangrovi TaxID=2972472 RepID=A0A9X2PAS2_9HYPH|nr:hypothetical protein [Ancylobacter mangrovi]MCS0495176.1 hypothetical protein [Ancylobacter mangrovi]